MIIVSALLLTGPWAMGTAAIGAMLCDIISGYAIYAPATFIIKGVMAGIVQLFLRRKTNTRIGFTYVIGALVAEMFMVAGYFVYEALLIKLFQNWEFLKNDTVNKGGIDFEVRQKDTYCFFVELYFFCFGICWRSLYGKCGYYIGLHS